ncbi:hypothetical protein RQP46_004835 [Phenoliferia psychrophenolica]
MLTPHLLFLIRLQHWIPRRRCLVQEGQDPVHRLVSVHSLEAGSHARRLREGRVRQCNNGYATNASGACVANSATCGPDACDPLEDGHVSCSGDNKCTYSCVNGFKLYKSNGSNVCLKLASDPENCGAVGNVCPHGYLGQAPVCKTGTCQNLHLAA